MSLKKLDLISSPQSNATAPTVELYRPPAPPHTLLTIASAIVFILLAMLFIPRIGIQNDESLFATVIYGPVAREFRLRAFGHDVPLMVMTYVGTLKTWLFAAIFRVWEPSVWSLRIPVVAAGAATIFLFARLLGHTLGRTATWIGVVLLATDVTYLLTTTFDWGPVALQHLLMVSAMLLTVKFTQSYRLPLLFLASVCIGLAAWDKAIFTWSMAGLGLATVLVFRQEVLVLLKPVNLVIALAGFLVGSWPLLLYNARNHGATFAGNATLVPHDAPGKFIHARLALNGSALFGYLIREEWEAPPAARPLTSSVERTTVALRDKLGERREGFLGGIILVCLMLTPLWWKKSPRPVIFAGIYLIVTWFMMAMTKDAGGSAHHVVLMWPMPHFLVAAALAPIADRERRTWMLVLVVVAAACVQNLMVANQYLSQVVRSGPALFWTDALEPVRRIASDKTVTSINSLDWGIDYSLMMLEKGRLPLRGGMTFQDPPTPEQLAIMKDILGEKNPIWVSHIPEFETSPDLSKKAAKVAEAVGYRRETIEIVKDAVGRPIFDVFRFVKAGR